MLLNFTHIKKIFHPFSSLVHVELNPRIENILNQFVSSILEKNNEVKVDFKNTIFTVDLNFISYTSWRK